MTDLTGATTRLGPAGVLTQPAGSMLRTLPPGDPRPDGALTQLSAAGVPGRRYGDMSGREEWQGATSYLSQVPLSPSLTIGPFTEQEAQDEFALDVSLTLTTQIFKTVTRQFALSPALTLAATVSSSNISRSGSMSLTPSLTLTTSLQRPAEGSVSLVPSLTLSATVDSSPIETLASVSLVPDLTLAATVYNLTPSPSVSLVPDLTLQVQVDRIASEITVNLPMTLGFAMTLGGSVNEGGDVDEIEFSARTFYEIEFEVV
jgi:hypothetical protein